MRVVGYVKHRELCSVNSPVDVGCGMDAAMRATRNKNKGSIARKLVYVLWFSSKASILPVFQL